MEYNRNKIVEKIVSWKGAKRGSEAHKHIIDIYNSINPLPNGYRVSYKDAWCAATVSACFHDVGYDGLIPYSASCNDMINKAKKMGIWIEDDSYIPSKGDVIMYDWQDSSTNYFQTDCTGQAEHTGIITAVSTQYITVYEGNMGSNSILGERRIQINGRYIRGFITPKYDGIPAKPTPSTPKRPTLKKGSSGSDVEYLNNQLRKLKYGCSGSVYNDVTEKCVINFQAVNRLVIDGICGPKTWELIEKIK
ncbi:MAG: peptidoglycan-binding protein [Prevotellaceae bacterium]|nr:peptidoglycan-binding protein [Prevotellaceae bacterium]